MSSSDSWTLIGLTILVVLLIFYLSKKMICGTGPSGNSGQVELGSDGLENSQIPPNPNYQYEYYDSENLGGIISSNGFGSFDNFDNLGQHVHHHHHHHQGIDTSLIDPIEVSIISSASPTSVTAAVSPNTQGTNTNSTMMMMTIYRKNMIESKLRAQIVRMVQAEREVQRLANLLSIEQGLGLNGDEYITAFRNNLLHPHHHHHNHPPTLATATATTNTNSNGTSSHELILSTETLQAQDDHIHNHETEQLNLDLDQPPPPYDECVPR